MKRPLQPFSSAREHDARSRQQASEPSQLITTLEANEQFLRYRGRHWLRSVYRFIEKKNVRTVRRFRTVLIKRQSLLAALDGGVQTSVPRLTGSVR